MKIQVIVNILEKFWRFWRISEAAIGSVPLEKVLLGISQNPQENTCARVSSKKVAGWGFIKNETGTGVFLWILRNF